MHQYCENRPSAQPPPCLTNLSSLNFKREHTKYFFLLLDKRERDKEAREREREREGEEEG